MTASPAVRRFRPHPLLTLAAGVLFAATLKLSFWQFSRAAEKESLEQTAAAMARGDTVTLRAVAATPAPFQRAAVVGEYLPEKELLLDNRTHNGGIGYHVVTPLVFADGGGVVVNRGFVGGDGRRDVLPAVPPPPRGVVTVRGVFYHDNRDAFTLSDRPERGKVRQNLLLAEVAADLRLPLIPLVLHRNGGDGGRTLAAAAVPTDFKSARSTVYAWQWLTFAALTVIFYLLLGLKKTAPLRKNEA